MKTPFIVVIFAGLLSGCSSLQGPAAPKKFTVEKSWVRSTLKEEFAGFRRMNRMTPLVLGQIVIQANAIDGMTAHNRETGSQIWRLDLRNGVEGGAAVYGNKIFFGSSDGQFYAVQADNGRIVWTFPVRAETLSAPTVEGNVVYFQSGTDIVYALDAGTGKQLWYYNRQSTTNFSIRATTRPTVTEESVYVGFSDGFIVALKKKDGGLLWERKLGRANRFRDIDSSPVADGSSLYVSSFDGALFSLKAESGEIQWQYDEGSYVPVTINGDRLYHATVSGQLVALEKATGKKIWSVKVQNGIATQPAMFRGYLVYGESEGALRVVDSANGDSIGHYFPGRGLVSAPAISEATGEVFFVSNNANLYALKLGWNRIGTRLPWQTEWSN